MNVVTPPSPTGIVSSATVGARRADAPCCLDRGDDASYRLRQSSGPDRLHDEVGGAHLEGVDRARVVRGHEHHLRPVGEAGQNPGQLDAVQAGHLDVAEEHVNGSGVQRTQGVGAVGRGPDVADPFVLAQQVGQLGQRRWLVINQQRTQTGRGRRCVL